MKGRVEVQTALESPLVIDPTVHKSKDDSLQLPSNLDLVSLFAPRESDGAPSTSVKRTRNRSSLPEPPWEERLAPFSKDELSQIKCHEFLNTRAHPNALNEIMAHAMNVADARTRLAAWVRCKVLRVPIAEYAILMGLSENTLRRLESVPYPRGSKAPAAVFSTVLTGWSKLASATSNDAARTSLLQAREEFLARLPGVSTSSSFGILRRWGYEVGRETLFAALSSGYKTYWAREHSKAYFSFSRLLAAGQAIGKIPANVSAAEIVRHPEVSALMAAWVKDCRRSGRPVGISRVHALLACAGIHVTSRALCLHPEIHLTSRPSVQIARFAAMSWKSITPVVDFLSRHSLLDKAEVAHLRKTVQREQSIQRDSFEGKLRQLARLRGIDNRALADTLGLLDGKDDKPLLPVYRALRYGEFRRAVPAGVFAILLGRTAQEISELLDQKRSELREALIRKHSTIKSPVYVERMLWGLRVEDLPYPKRDLHTLEWRLASASLSQNEVLAKVFHTGLERGRVALNRWLELHDYGTVKTAVSSLVKELPQAMLETRARISTERIISVSKGEEVPPLPALERILQAGNRAISRELERNWFVSYAKQRLGENESDLERLISTFIASRAESRKDYLSKLGQNSLTAARFFRSLATTGTTTADDLRTLGRDLKIPDDSLFASLLEFTRASGSSQKAYHLLKAELTRTGAQADLERLRSLEKLVKADIEYRESKEREGLSLEEALRESGASPRAGISAEEEELASIALHALPGLTERELVSRSRTSLEPCRELFEELLTTGASRGLTREALTFSLQSSQPGVRHAHTLASESLDAKASIPATPLGILAGLVSTSDQEDERLIARARSAVKERYARLGMSVQPVQVELHLWGVRIDDLPAGKKYKEAALWSAKRRSRLTAQITKEIEAVAESKLAIAIDRLLFIKKATFVPDICSILVDNSPEGAKGIGIACRISVAAAARFAAGQSIPSLQTYRQMAAYAGLSLTERHELGWHLSCADFIARTTPLPAMRFITHFGLAHPNFDELTRSQKGDVLEKARTVALIVTGIDTPPNLSLLSASKSNPNAARKLLTNMLDAPGSGSGLTHSRFARQVSEGASVRDALQSLNTEQHMQLGALTNYCNELLDTALLRRAYGKTFTLNALKVLKRQVFSPEPLESHLERPGSTVGALDFGALLSTMRELHGTTLWDLTRSGTPLHEMDYEARFSALLEHPLHSDTTPTKRRINTRKSFEQTAAQEESARLKALQESEREAREVEARAREEDALNQRKLAEESRIFKLVQRLTSNGRPTSEPPSKETIARWCEKVGSPGLSARYASLNLAAQEGPQKGLSHEEAFVRAYVALLNRLESFKKKADSGGGPRIIHLP